LTAGAALPSSQVVRALARVSAATPLTADNIPPISANPAPGNVITIGDGMINVPN
jgi:hydroxybutyrate-dimer hydrolase